MRTHPAIMLGCLAVWLLPGTLAAQALPFEGKWARRAALCRADPGQASEENPLPIVLTQRRLVAAAMVCEFTSVLPGGLSFRVEADCLAGDAHGHEFFTFARLGGFLQWSWGGRTESFVSC